MGPGKTEDRDVEKAEDGMIQRRVPHESHPWLVFFHGKHGKTQTLYSISDDRYHDRHIPCLRRKRLCASSHGWWVLLDEYSDDCFLLNPISMDKIQLPPWEKPSNYYSCVLSSPPSDPSCTVMFIDRSRRDHDLVSFVFCSPTRSDCWNEQEMKLGDDIEDATCCNGKIYGFAEAIGEIFIIDVVDTSILEVRKMRMKEGIPEIFALIKQVIIESRRELYVVRKIYLDGVKPNEIENFEIFKAVGVDHSSRGSSTEGYWERVESLGDRAFFLGPHPHCCISYSTNKEDQSGGLGLITGNTIYYTMPEDRSLYAFNLEDRSITVSLPCANVKHHWSQPTWVSPSLLQ